MNHYSLPVLETERLNLRELREEDEADVFQLRSSAQVNQYLDRDPCTCREEARSFIQKIINGYRTNECFYWAIIMKQERRFAGTISLFNFSHDEERAEVGFELIPQFHGRGIMKEALAAVINFGFSQMGLKAIDAYTHSENKASGNLLARFGFKVHDDHLVSSDKKFIRLTLEPGHLP